MGRLSNRDVDDLTQMTYEDALADGEPWADEALRVREWAALDGKRVMVEFDDGCKARGRWQWRGQTAEDFYCVWIIDPKGELIVGTDARNFEKVTVLRDR